MIDVLWILLPIGIILGFSFGWAMAEPTMNRLAVEAAKRKGFGKGHVSGIAHAKASSAQVTMYWNDKGFPEIEPLLKALHGLGYRRGPKATFRIWPESTPH